MSKVLIELHALLDEVPVASLAVQRDGAAEVSLVPFLVRRAPLRFVLLVSELSAHTSALRGDPRCALLVHRGVTQNDPRDHHAIERASVAVAARFLSRDEAAREGLDEAWRARFPSVSAMILPLRDFHFVALSVRDEGASFVQGFGRAFRALGPELDAVEAVTGH